MRIVLVLLAILCCCVAYAQQPAMQPQPSSGPSSLAASAPASGPSASSSAPARWRDRFGPKEVVQRIRPEYNDAYLNNPHKGTTTFQRFNGDPLYPTLRWDDSKGPLEFPPPQNADLSNGQYPPTRIAYCRWAWRVLEPEKGKIRFDVLDAALKTAHDRGQTLQVRVQPWVNKEGPPEWYLQMGGTQRESGKGFDHNNPLYVQQWGDFIRVLGQRYDGHPDLESFDVAYGGQFGETGGNANYETAAKLVDIYRQSFKKTTLLLMLGSEGCKYASTLTGVHFGWRADSFGDVRKRGMGVVPDELSWNHMYEAYPPAVQESVGWDAWKYAPVTFESAGTPASWKRANFDIDWIIEQGYKYHMSVFMPKSVAIPEEWMPKIMEFNKRLGYRFFIQQMSLPLEARAGQEIQVFATIDNKGVAPIYRPYHFALRFSQGGRHYIVKLKQDIRTWMPDLTFFREKFIFPKELKLGEVKVACSIVNDRDEPVVKLAIKPLDEDGWHPLTSMDVVETDSPPIDSVTLPPMD